MGDKVSSRRNRKCVGGSLLSIGAADWVRTQQQQQQRDIPSLFLDFLIGSIEIRLFFHPLIFYDSLFLNGRGKNPFESHREKRRKRQKQQQQQGTRKRRKGLPFSKIESLLFKKTNSRRVVVSPFCLVIRYTAFVARSVCVGRAYQRVDRPIK